jgi:hypothetical protein
VTGLSDVCLNVPLFDKERETIFPPRWRRLNNQSMAPSILDQVLATTVKFAKIGWVTPTKYGNCVIDEITLRNG